MAESDFTVDTDLMLALLFVDVRWHAGYRVLRVRKAYDHNTPGLADRRV